MNLKRISIIYFNSRAHVERDPGCLAYRRMLAISTHALTWSATSTVKRVIKAWLISTHALTWSATGFRIGETFAITNFNSRAHVERDTRRLDSLASHAHFNSRAHVERDFCGNVSRGVHPHFNSRAHVERDAFSPCKCNAFVPFQLTRSRGARHGR